ncbi:hypothetical protein RF11_12938 [Thelohanellus kitauei]|uniref:Uncharacterized protein n=1 Tax=Thelohanellus kitauei TaxID=669202 RepID=A0A0C2MCF6_THEKT|nr:hypothetical protein RF11_12938 [Thelohanellus kitauei]
MGYEGGGYNEARVEAEIPRVKSKRLKAKDPREACSLRNYSWRKSTSSASESSPKHPSVDKRGCTLERTLPQDDPLDRALVPSTIDRRVGPLSNNPGSRQHHCSIPNGFQHKGKRHPTPRPA